MISVIVLFTLIVWRAFVIATESHLQKRQFAGFMAQGIGLWIGIQSFFNMGVNLGILPTKGITLPFMSFGGNSILVTCLAIGLLLRIDRENRQQRHGKETTEDVWAEA